MNLFAVAFLSVCFLTEIRAEEETIALEGGGVLGFDQQVGP